MPEILTDAYLLFTFVFKQALKEEAKKKGDIASILIIEDKHYRGYSQSSPML